MTLVFFGYTHCPDICNVVLANFASALRGATPAVRKDVRMLFVTTDPARDTPDVVRDYLDRFDPTYEGLVAPVGTVAEGGQGALHQLREAGRLAPAASYQVVPRHLHDRLPATGRRGSSGRRTPPSPTSARTSPGSRG